MKHSQSKSKKNCRQNHAERWLMAAQRAERRLTQGPYKGMARKR